MKKILNVSVTADTWTEIQITTSYLVAQYVMQTRSSTATLSFSYHDTNDVDRDANRITVRPNGVWVDALLGKRNNTTVWVKASEDTVIEIESTLRGNG